MIFHPGKTRKPLRHKGFPGICRVEFRSPESLTGGGRSTPPALRLTLWPRHRLLKNRGQTIVPEGSRGGKPPLLPSGIVV